MALPAQAREGLMRAWLKVLSDRHPDVTWIPVPPAIRNSATAASPGVKDATHAELANSA